jgi:hypothetical protein
MKKKGGNIQEKLKLNSQPAQCKKNIFDKDNLKKNMWGNIVTIHSVFKKKNYEAKFSTNSIWKNKIDKGHFGKTNS